MLDCLQGIAAWLGRFLRIDNATIYRMHATRAEICMEGNSLKEQIKGLPLRIDRNFVRWQEVMHKKHGFYFKSCFKKGHK